MKMICDVPDEVIKSIRMGTWCGSSVAEKMIANGTPIPDNATNGDVIKEIFPNTSLHINEMSHTVWVGCEEMSFRIDWWNSPYQEGE